MLQFLPDADPITPGLLTRVVNMAPSPRGYAGFPSGAATSYPALGAGVRASALISRLDGNQRFFAGTGTALYEGASGVWTDVTRAVGGAYNVGAEGTWTFAQFGNTTLAAQRGDKIQRSQSGTFADIAGAPQAAVVFTVGTQVMALNTIDASYGDTPDRWWCSADLDETDWTPNVATACATGQLIDVPGPIIGGRALGSLAIAYKTRGIFVGTFVGGAAVWQWERIPGAVGAVSNESIVSIDNAHYFIGNEDIWVFDGSRPVPIGQGIRDWFFARLSKDSSYLIKGAHDRANSQVMWWYPAEGETTLDNVLIYNYRYQRWGHASLSVDCPVETVAQTWTIEALSSLSSTIDGLPDIPFDSPFWASGQPIISYFDTSHTLYNLSGTPISCSLTTGTTGDDEGFTTVTRVVPRFVTRPATGTMTHRYMNTSGDAWTSGAASTLTNNRFDALWSARWHSFVMSFTGAVEITDYKVSFQPDGQE